MYSIFLMYQPGGLRGLLGMFIKRSRLDELDELDEFNQHTGHVLGRGVQVRISGASMDLRRVCSGLHKYHTSRVHA